MENLTLNFIQGKNCVGKTQYIRELLSYEIEEYCKNNPDLPKYNGLENRSFRILKTINNGLIIKYFLAKECKKCTEIIRIKSKLDEQRTKLSKRDELIRESKLVEKEISMIMKSKKDKDPKIKQKIRDLENDLRLLSNRQGYKQLKDAVEFNKWKFYNLLEQHSNHHNIDLWITITQKNNLTLFFRDIMNMSINRLFIESLNKSWLLTEIEDNIDRVYWIPNPVYYKLEFPHRINEIYIETKSNEDKVTISKYVKKG